MRSAEKPALSISASEHLALARLNPGLRDAGVLAWGAQRAAAGALQGTGALGPVESFGLDVLQTGAAEAGLVRE